MPTKTSSLPLVALAVSLILFVSGAQWTLSQPRHPAWGEAVDGLRCRLAAISDTVHEGDRVGMILHFDYQRPKGETRVLVLNPLFDRFRVSFRFNNVKTTDTYERHFEDFVPFGRGLGCDEAAPVFPPLDSLTPDTFYIPLLDSDGHGIPTGDYLVSVVYQNDGTSGFKPDPAELYRGLWAGTLQMPPIPLTIVAAPDTESVVYVSSNICYVHGLWSWSPNDSIAIRVHRRPGQWIGRKFDVYVVMPDTVKWISGGYSSATSPDRRAAFGGLTALARFDSSRFIRITTEIYETGVAGGHMRFPESRDSTIYRVIWSHTYEFLPDTLRPCPEVRGRREGRISPR